MMTPKIIRITAPHFVAGVFTYDGEKKWRPRKGGPLVQCHKCAPILNYMEKWTIPDILRYCTKKGWEYELLG